MSAATYNITIEQNVTYILDLVWYASTAENDPIDLTGYTAVMHIRSRKDSATTLYTLTEGDGITLGDTLGTILIEIADEDTLGFRFSEGYYDVLLTDPDGEQTRLVQGTVTISKAVTR